MRRPLRLSNLTWGGAIVSWTSRWWTLWRRQPVLWGIAGGYLVLGVMVAALDVGALFLQAQQWPEVLVSPTVGRPNPTLFWVMGIQVLSQGLSLLLLLLLAALLWSMRLAYPQPERPVPWQAVGRGLLMVLLRVLFVYAAFFLFFFFLVIIWVSMGVFLGLGLIIVMVLAFGGQDQPALTILLGFGIFWLFLWLAFVLGGALLNLNSVCEAVGEERFQPSLWMRHMLRVTQRYWKRFLGLALGQGGVMMIAFAPLAFLGLGVASWTGLKALVGWSVIAGWYVVLVVLGLGWLSFWAVAYFDAHEAVWGTWPPLATLSASAGGAASSVSGQQDVGVEKGGG